MILAGDIGGTKTFLCLFEEVSSRKIFKEERFVSSEHASLEEIVQKFLSSVSVPISHACFGIAGPIQNNKCYATNLPWVVEGEKLKVLIKTPHVFLINDLEANAWGISCLNKEEFFVLSEGDGDKIGNRALISAGTGLGEAGLYFTGKEHLPFASEGGHCNFAPNNEEEVEIWRYIQKKFGHASYERVLSGQGIENIYSFWIEEKKEKEQEEVKKRRLEEDPAKVIHEYALNGKCPICKKTMEQFVSIYGSESGNLALKFLAVGGLYIGGGIAPKILDLLKEGSFLESFRKKGRFEKLLSAIPIQVILNYKAAILGAGRYAEHKKQTSL